MHDNSRKFSSIGFSTSSSLDADRFTANHSESPGHMSLLKFSDASDSDSSGETGDQVKLVSHACAMRDIRKTKNPNKKEPGRMGNALSTVGAKKYVLVLKAMCVLT